MLAPISCAILVVAAILFGGGTRHGFIGDALVQLAALPAIATICLRWRSIRDSASVAVLLFLGLWAALAVVQLLAWPVPRTATGGLTGLGDLLAAHRNVSLTPAATAASLLYAIVPVAAFLITSELSVRQRRLALNLILALALVSLIVGLAQMAQGPESALRFFTFTNPMDAVGFFANRNHFAALLYVSLVIALVWLVASIRASLRPGAVATSAVLWACAAFGLLVALLSGLVYTRSRAGLILAMLALAIGYLMIATHLAAGRHTPRGPKRLTAIVIGIAAFVAVQGGLYRILSRFEADPLDDLRLPLARTTLEAIPALLPFGTGLGSFVPVYAALEKAEDATTVFANRAHNDVLEIVLETGLIGLVMIVLFLAWYAVRTVAAWRRGSASPDDEQRALSRMASLIVGLLVLHSIVDYPLRTGAMATIFGLCCGILAFPPRLDETGPDQRETAREPPHAHAAPISKPREFRPWTGDRPWPAQGPDQEPNPQ